MRTPWDSYPSRVSRADTGKQQADLFSCAGMGWGACAGTLVVAAAEGGRGEQTVGVGVSWFSSMQSPSPPSLVSSVCTHAHTHTHTRYLPTQRPYSSQLGRTRLPWALTLARPVGREWLAPVQGLPQRLDAYQLEATGCQPWTEALHIPLVSLVLTAGDS